MIKIELKFFLPIKANWHIYIIPSLSHTNSSSRSSKDTRFVRLLTIFKIIADTVLKPVLARVKLWVLCLFLGF